MSDKYVGLCYRCEYRAQYHECGYRPRLQCGDDCAVINCYMYKPVTPVVTAVDLDDPRPAYAAPVISARSNGIRIPKGTYKLHQYMDGDVVYWVPSDKITKEE